MSNVTDLTYMMGLVVTGAAANVAREGGPFAAALVNPQLNRFHYGVNQVTRTNDPTAHAEVAAIRAACASESTFDLTGWTLVTSCYPCPMCLAAALWAHVGTIVYAATPDEAADAGFDDRAFHDQFRTGHFEPTIYRLPGTVEPTKPFKAWQEYNHRTDY